MLPVCMQHVESQCHELSLRAQAFNLFDANQSGVITEKEFRDAMKVLGFRMSKEAIHDLFIEHDDDGSGELDFPEFVQMLTGSSIITGQQSSGVAEVATEIAQLRESFSLFDLDGDGVLSFNEIKEALLKLGSKLTDKEIWNMLAEADDDCDGTLSFPEFVVMMSQMKQNSNDEASQEAARLAAALEEAERAKQPYFDLRQALQLPCEQRLDRDIDLILDKVPVAFSNYK